ncbi:response regulator transcription factor [Oleiharenicola lentus]|uniref:Response regulator transcription factor n=1 Tax=Oleiharenicola lentus TaxID=2508720 RepID=A0A4Q1C916_9BACT|nr:response regulator transcription factor [Oleiharenicola lentus]RXK55301.1 response regulator transcription factor [Oleiharenicola lentus]
MSVHFPVSLHPKILLVDDCDLHRAVCSEVLRHAGYQVMEAGDGLEGLRSWSQHPADLVILDVNMPGLDGWGTLARLRQLGFEGPVIIFSSETSVDCRVRGLTEGADDYICKPCDDRELLARVNASLRRHGAAAPARLPVLHFGDTVVDLARSSARNSAGDLHLTRTELALLALFARHGDRTLPRSFILHELWGYDGELPTRTVETHIYRLRHKLGDSADAPRWIITVPGGYRMQADLEPVAA